VFESIRSEAFRQKRGGGHYPKRVNFTLWILLFNLGEITSSRYIVDLLDFSFGMPLAN
jgi:hypothetical protein